MFKQTLLAFAFMVGAIAGVSNVAHAGFADDGGFFNRLTGNTTDIYANVGRGHSTLFAATSARSRISYTSKYSPGSIIVDTKAKFLYYIEDSNTAMRYGIGTARLGFEWGGNLKISRKTEWPGWTPPPAMRKREPWLPRHMPGGPTNPLGARALYLGSSLYRIHGTNQGTTIGRSVSSGCIRMHNKDVMDLYERVRIGAKVVVLR